MQVTVTRRKLIIALGPVAAWPFAVGAQQGEQIRRVGVLMNYRESDPAGQLRATAFQQELEKRGWIVGRNLRIDYHWGIGGAGWIRSEIEQLLRPTPDVILANGDAAAREAQVAAHTIPVVFIAGADPVGGGYVQSLAHPGGNLTGFTVLEPSLGPKLLELLKEIAPRLRLAAVLFNSDNPGNRQLSDAAAAAKSGIEVVATPVRESSDIHEAITKLGREPNTGLIVLPDPGTNSHRKLIVELAARYQLPAIHALRAATVDGALMSYGVDLPDLFRRAASYVDRILRGEKPADLPVQQPTKFELIINIKTAKALGLIIPDNLLATADEVIE
ncbi:MAG: ABC transporter substrate-binding protein [Alphaproteobacteria bacterium]|nr:ABC transporter substrate-binding protein [Alphaproteobacteria bacterium]